MIRKILDWVKYQWAYYLAKRYLREYYMADVRRLQRERQVDKDTIIRMIRAATRRPPMVDGVHPDQRFKSMAKRVLLGEPIESVLKDYERW